MRIKRVFHHYKLCEEYESNMWKYVLPETRQGYVDAAAALMIDWPRFEEAMMRAVNEWPYSCEANLSASCINHQAWIGHAGCAIAVGSPEDLTRLGWRTLTQDQQDLANAAADRCIAAWREKYIREKLNA